MVQWRNGNAARCKRAKSRFDSDLHLQMLPWLEWRGIRLLSGHDAGSNPAGSAGHVAQMEEHPVPSGKRAGSIPAVVTNSESERERSRASPAKRSAASAVRIMPDALLRGSSSMVEPRSSKP